MMRRVSKITLLCLLCVLLLGAGAARAQGRPASLDDVVLLAQSGLSDDTILSFLETRSIGFVLSATSIVQLRAAGVSEVIIRYLSVALPVASPLRNAAAQVPIFRAGTEVVTLTATVLKDKSGYVTDLEREDFTVYEDGASQTIAFFRSGEQASVSMAIVIDTSGSMVDKLEDVEDAVKHLIATIRPEDEVAVLTFNTYVDVVAGLSSPGSATLDRAIDKLRAGGMTALYDALDQGLEIVSEGTHEKKVLILVTDGKDNRSRLGHREVVHTATRSEVLVYCLGIGHGKRGSFWSRALGLRGPGGGDSDTVDIKVLESFSDQTGGRSYLLEDAHRGGGDLIDEAVLEIVTELRQQYTLGYYSSNAEKDGSYRRIKVETVNPAYAVRTRHGYWAEPRSSP